MRAKTKPTRARHKKSVVKKSAVRALPKKHVPGFSKGKIWAPNDAFAPMTKEELAEWGID